MDNAHVNPSILGIFPNPMKSGDIPHKTEVWRFVTFALKTYQNRWSGPEGSFRQHQGAWKNSIQTASLDSFWRLKFSWSNVGSQKSLFFKYDDVQGYVLLFNKSLHSQLMLQVWYKQKIVCRWIGSSISQPSSCQREQERLEAAQWCLPLVRSDQESYIRRFIGRLACHGRNPIFNAFEILFEFTIHQFFNQYLYHQVSVSDTSKWGVRSLIHLPSLWGCWWTCLQWHFMGGTYWCRNVTGVGGTWIATAGVQKPSTVEFVESVVQLPFLWKSLENSMVGNSIPYVRNYWDLS